jgi:Family of unknown function (DUF5677)
MSEIRIGVGDAEAQQQFLRKNKEFLKEHTEIHTLLKKVFVRKLAGSRAEPQMEELGEGLSLSEAEATAVEDRRMAEFVIFYLGRAAADDFGELLILCGNGRGIGAYKILRGMYERVVTAAFIAKNPSEARLFLSYSFIQREKLWNRLVNVLPDIEDERTPEQVKEFEAECKEARAKLKASYCNKCNQPITQEEWTRKSLETMAEKADANLAVSYAYCYLLPTFHSHATAFGLESRLRRTEKGYSFREISEVKSQSSCKREKRWASSPLVHATASSAPAELVARSA